jgi:ATP-dependent Clp protease protease subunit
MDIGKDFRKYAMSEHNLSSMNLHYFENQIEDSMTPYILEEREMRVTQMDIFSRLMRERLLWVAGPVNDRMSTVVQAQLMYLDSTDNLDITMHVDSPGGSVKSGLSMVDVMDYIKCDIRTVNTGMAASMGSVLLGAGTKGKRSSLRFSKTMLHQSSGGAGGNIQDARINFIEWEKTCSNYWVVTVVNPPRKLLKMLQEIFGCLLKKRSPMELLMRLYYLNNDKNLRNNPFFSTEEGLFSFVVSIMISSSFLT